jgi:hypothetical protein
LECLYEPAYNLYWCCTCTWKCWMHTLYMLLEVKLCCSNLSTALLTIVILYYETGWLNICVELNLTISPFSFVTFCFIYVETILLNLYVSVLIWLIIKLFFHSLKSLCFVKIFLSFFVSLFSVFPSFSLSYGSYLCISTFLIGFNFVEGKVGVLWIFEFLFSIFYFLL